MRGRRIHLASRSPLVAQPSGSVTSRRAIRVGERTWAGAATQESTRNPINRDNCNVSNM